MDTGIVQINKGLKMAGKLAVEIMIKMAGRRRYPLSSIYSDSWKYMNVRQTGKLMNIMALLPAIVLRNNHDK